MVPGGPGPAREPVRVRQPVRPPPTPDGEPVGEPVRPTPRLEAVRRPVRATDAICAPPQSVRESVRTLLETVRQPVRATPQPVRQAVRSSFQPVRESVRAPFETFRHAVRPAATAVREPARPPGANPEGLAREPVRHPAATGGFRRCGDLRFHDAVRRFRPTVRRLAGLRLQPEVLTDLVLDGPLPEGVEFLGEADFLEESGPAVRAFVRVDGDLSLAGGAWHGVAGACLLILPAHNLLGLPTVLPGPRLIPEAGGQLRAKDPEAPGRVVRLDKGGEGPDRPPEIPPRRERRALRENGVGILPVGPSPPLRG